MYGRATALVAIALWVGACGGGASQTARVAAPSASEMQVSLEAVESQLDLGKRTFETMCIACHTMDSPPTLAPPMTHVARHYRRAFEDEAEAIEHIVNFIRNPSHEASKMPERARERFGLMPALHLPEDQLRAVAAYVWSLPEPAPH